ncbi:MAG: divalent metal cation transporter [bacterium]|nr:divalent metal cation transporter [bacterium]
MRRLLSVIFWSVIAAAFIGPGTVTTAASAGAGHGLSLLWALAFSTVACIVLQEAAARLTIGSGLDLAQALRERHRGTSVGALVLFVVVGAILVGCAAYEAGNILGAVVGAALGLELSPAALTVATALLAGMLLTLGAPKTVARLLALLVALMGIAFLLTAWRVGASAGDVVRGLFVPTLPGGSGLLVLGLIGTTVVPYNLFLGSGIARGQSLPELRFGLAVAVGLGGLISMGIVVVGTAVSAPLELGALGDVLESRLGGGMRRLFAAGLFAAGLSSAVTAPLAAAITARGLFANEDEAEWRPTGLRFRAVWIAVLGVGIGFGLSGIRPVPVILVAQALNGILLPLVAVFLLVAVNDRRLVGAHALNGPLSNTLLVVVVALTTLLGLLNVMRAASAAFGVDLPGGGTLIVAATLLTAGLAWPVARVVRRVRSAA